MTSEKHYYPARPSLESVYPGVLALDRPKDLSHSLPQQTTPGRTAHSSSISVSSKRSSVTIPPTSDPFARDTFVPLDGEDWRISEESELYEVQNGGAEILGDITPAFSETGKTASIKSKSSGNFSTVKAFLRGKKSSNSIDVSLNPQPPAPGRISIGSISTPMVRNAIPRLAEKRHSLISSLSLSRSSRHSYSSSIPRSASFSGSPSASQAGSQVGSTQNEFELPTTASDKAFEMLGGPKITCENVKAIEKLTGHRTSFQEERTDAVPELSIAINSDTTRHIVPDNRLSLYSNSTSHSTFHYSPYLSSRSASPSPTLREREYAREHRDAHTTSIMSVLEADEEVYDPHAEDVEPVNMHAVRTSLPELEAPTAPLPPIPTLIINESEDQSDLVVVSKEEEVIHQRMEPNLLLRPHSTIRAEPAPPAKTLASLYLVCGLPREPSTWTLSDLSSIPVPPAHLPNAVPRFWRPQILTSASTGEGMDCREVELGGMDGVRNKKKVGGAAKEEYHVFSREVIGRIQAKAMKMAFNRDVEIITSTVQPPCTTSTFSFSLKLPAPAPRPSLSGATAAQWDDSLLPSTLLSEEQTQVFHVASLLVWSHADPNRALAIRETLERGSRAKSEAIKKSLRAAKAGRRLGKRLGRGLDATGFGMGGALGGLGSDGDESQTEGYTTESEWGDVKATSRPLAQSSLGLPFWLPYSLILVSTEPVYNVLTDILRISWARYHQSLTSFALSMHRILHVQIPKPSDKLHLPVEAEGGRTCFVTRMPGRFDFKTDGTGGDFPVWPVFRALDSDTILKIAEIALAPLGRVLFFSNHSVMLGLVIQVFQTILDQRGWKGLSHTSIHAREVQLYIEDPGPWIISIPTQSRSTALAVLPPEVAVVDIDTNSIVLGKECPGTFMKGAERDRAVKMLSEAVALNSNFYSVPSELTEAYPGGRFRPFSEVEVGGVPKDAERLRPNSEWTFNQTQVLQVLDSILSLAPRTTILSRVFRTRRKRQLKTLSPEALHVQQIIRSHVDSFVDNRDLLEARINSMNLKLAQLMSESQEWQKSLSVFKSYSDKLNKESSHLKSMLDRERKEARRLTGVVGIEKERQAQLEASLEATNAAREQALLQLEEVEAIKENLEQQKNLLIAEMKTVLSVEDTDPIIQAVYSRIESASTTSGFSSRPTTAQSHHDFGYKSMFGFNELSTSSNGMERLEDEPEEKIDAIKLAVQESLAVIQTKLSIALSSAERIQPTSPRASITGSPRKTNHSLNAANLGQFNLSTTSVSRNSTIKHGSASPQPSLGDRSKSPAETLSLDYNNRAHHDYLTVERPDTPPVSPSQESPISAYSPISPTSQIHTSFGSSSNSHESPETVRLYPKRFTPKPLHLASPTPSDESSGGGIKGLKSAGHARSPSVASNFTGRESDIEGHALTRTNSFGRKYTPGVSPPLSEEVAEVIAPEYVEYDTDADSFVSVSEGEGRHPRWSSESGDMEWEDRTHSRNGSRVELFTRTRKRESVGSRQNSINNSKRSSVGSKRGSVGGGPKPTVRRPVSVVNEENL